ncbi:MAG: hypothetical protein ACOVT5_09950, partial [Armatimonadaceae bacterium]
NTLQFGRRFAETLGMVRVMRRRSGNGLLVGSDLDDLTEARREVDVWVRERAGEPGDDLLKLAIAEGGKVVREYVVVDEAGTGLPSTPVSRRRRGTGGSPGNAA